MRTGAPRLQKPPVGTQIDWGNALTGPAALAAFCPLNEATGGTCSDLVTKLQLATVSAPAWAAGIAGGLQLSANGQGASANLPSQLKLALPITLGIGLRILGAASGNTTVWGLGPAGSPNANFAIWANTSTELLVRYAANGTSSTATSAFTAGTDHVIFATATAAGALTIFVDGASAVTGTGITTGAYSSAQLAFGAFSGRNSNVLAYWGGVWNSAIPASAIAAIGRNVNAIWQIFADPLPLADWAQSTKVVTAAFRSLVVPQFRPSIRQQPIRQRVPRDAQIRQTSPTIPPQTRPRPLPVKISTVQASRVEQLCRASALVARVLRRQQPTSQPISFRSLFAPIVNPASRPQIVVVPVQRGRRAQSAQLLRALVQGTAPPSSYVGLFLDPYAVLLVPAGTDASAIGSYQIVEPLDPDPWNLIDLQ